MPTFTSHSGTDRNLRVLPSYAPPLPQGRSSPAEVRSPASPPRTAPSQPAATPQNCHSVVIVGAGPAGLFLKLLLSRYGLSDAEVLCVDQKPGSLQTGQADGLQPRTLEVLATLGLAHEVLAEGCHMWEVGFWNASSSSGATGIERTSYAPDVVARARFPHEVTIHQGRIERILEEDLARYSPQGVRRSTRFVGLRGGGGAGADAGSLREPHPQSEARAASEVAAFPLTVSLEHTDEASGTVTPYSVRARHVVAADGAHSAVRAAAGLRLVGESRDYIWGVVDFVADTDFPDIRRRCAIHSARGSAMVIPRERIATGEYLTRLYVQVDDVDDGGEARAEAKAEAKAEGGHRTEADAEAEAMDGSADTAENEVTAGPSSQETEAARAAAARRKRSRVTLDALFAQAAAVFAPYYLRMKAGSEPDWWAAYQIGQRMADHFCKADEMGVPRVFVAGDAAHTHSPKAGQGMNVSLMDSYNLAWKLAYYLRGLGPPDTKDGAANAAHLQSQPGLDLLRTYASEREANARNLIDFDTRFSSMFSGKVGSTEHDASGEPLTHERFLELFSAASGFSSGCGIEYESSVAISVAEGTAAGASSEANGAQHLSDNSPFIRTDWPAEKQNALLAGALWPGRRLVSVRVVRHADGVPMQLHEVLPSTGRFRVLLLLSDATGTPRFAESPSWRAIERVGEMLGQSLASGTVEMVALHPTPGIRGRSWKGFPPALKAHAEMRFFCAAPGEVPEGKEEGKMGLMGVAAEDAYAVLGVRKEVGAWAGVRPDGVIGAMGGFGEMDRLERYLGGLIQLRS